MLEVRNISKRYKETEALKDVSFSAEKGEIVSLLGANGSGKTTTFKIILGLLPQDTGEVFYNRRPLENRHTGYLPEERSMFYDVPIFEQLKFFGRLKGVDEKLLDDRISHLLDLTKTTGYRDSMPIQLSKGNQQKIQLIISILHDPEVIIMDEPWTGLDQENIALFQRVLLQQKKRGKIIILSSHQHQQVQEICDRYLYLKEGRISINVSRRQLENDRRRMLTYSSRSDVTLDKGDVIYRRKENGQNKFIVADENKAREIIEKIRKQTDLISYSVASLSISDLIGVKR